jgi:hypothetical protein
MSLKPGYPRRNNEDKVVIDDPAISNSMAGYIDQAMKDTYKAMKNEVLPTAGEEDRRILFVAIARGILSYLKQHENEFISSIRYDISTETYSVDTLNLDIQIEDNTV